MGQSEDQLRRVLDTLCTFVGVLAVDGTLLEVNQAALTATGISSSDVVGRKFWDCHWWNFSTESQQLLRVSIETAARGEHVRYDAIVRLAGNDLRWIDLHIAPLRDDDGRITRVVASAIEITERKFAEERLRAGEERLRRASRAARVGIWEWNTTTGSAYWSEEAHKLFGQSPDRDVTYKQWIASIHPDDRERAIEVTNDAVLAALQSPGEADYRDEYRIQHSDGSVTWVESVGAFRRENGQLWTMGVVRDVTERKQAEQALRNSEERLRFVAEGAGVGYWDWDIDSDTLEWSPLCKRLFGIDEEQPMSYEHFLAAVHPRDRHRVDESVRACLESGGRADYDIEFRTQWPDGTVHWIHTIGSATFQASRPVRLAGIALDITDRKGAEISLAEQSALLDTLTSKAPVGFAFVDKACRYVRVNATLAKMNGLSAPAHIGRTVAEVVPKVWPDVEVLYRKALAGEAVANVEVAAETRAIPGTVRHWLVSYYPVRVGWRILGVGTVVVDITTQKRTEALLKEADRRKDEFLATLAHELRNPLAPIRNAVHILKMQSSQGTASDAVTDIMDRQLHQLVRLIDDLLDVSRINHGKLQLRRAPVLLATVVNQALESSLPLIEESEHELTVSSPQHPIYVDADPVRLAQVLSNLLNNASKYTPRGGRIYLSADVKEGQAIVSVRDTGIGIPPERRQDIFEMFSQLRPEGDHAQGGLGIGLSLSKALVEMHGGSIDVKSDGPDEGSEFIVRLPALDATPLPPQRENVKAHAGPAQRILVADDNPDSAESLAMLLRLLGNEVETAGDGVEAVQVAQEYRPDVILLDIRMPKMNGYDACRAIREQPWSKDVVLIALTGYGQDKDREEARDAGFDSHLIKPVDVSSLMNVINSLPQSS